MPVDHVIVMMKENHSYDQFFGQLYLHGQPDSERMPPGFSNPDGLGQQVPAFHATSTCPEHDPDHQWVSMHAMVDGGKMDGFITSAIRSVHGDGHFVMAYFDDRDLPFYYFLANTYAIADRHFPSVRSGTWPNRDYMLLGTSDGVTRTGGGCPNPNLPTIFTELDARGVSWGAYSVDKPFEGTLCWPKDHAGVSDVPTFLARLADGTLPQVSFVDAQENVQDEHPSADVQAGERWTHMIYDAVVGSPLWPSTLLIWTYDEAGGFFDHVAPGTSCVARPEDSSFFELGVRVPLVMISPWARPHYVSHRRHEHASILRLIEVLFDLPALTARDANADALLDMLDFGSPALLNPPDAPAAGTGGCKR